MTIQITLKPEHLALAVKCTSKFRDRSGHRPILAGMHLRVAPGSDRSRVEVTATDSYHLVRVTVPVMSVKDPQSWLGRRGGVLIDLPASDVARFATAVAAAEKARLKAEREAITRNAVDRRWAKHRGRPTPKLLRPATPVAVRLTVSADDKTSRFGLTANGVWNGGGCYLSAVDGAADQVDRIVGGSRIGGQYVDVDGLIAKTVDGHAADRADVVAYNPEYLGDVCAAAAAFGGGGPMSIESMTYLKPTLLSATGVGALDGCTFTGLVMPVRVTL